jgi:hypothetical protein
MGLFERELVPRLATGARDDLRAHDGSANRLTSIIRLEAGIGPENPGDAELCVGEDHVAHGLEPQMM